MGALIDFWSKHPEDLGVHDDPIISGHHLDHDSGMP